MRHCKCLNCETVLHPEHRYCPQCGQRSDTHRLSFHEISHDAVHYFTHADKSIFTLIKELAFRPGVVAREYVAGKRQKYFKPLNFFLIVAGIVVFMTSSFYRPNDSRSQKVVLAAQRIQDPEKKQYLLGMAERIKNVGLITGKYSNVINMVATPLLALFFWLAYKRQYNFVECLVANMYFTGFIMLFYAFLIVPLQHLLPFPGFYLITAFFAFEVFFRGFAFYQFSGKAGVSSVLKAMGVSMLITSIWVAGTYTLIAAYIRKGF